MIEVEKRGASHKLTFLEPGVYASWEVPRGSTTGFRRLEVSTYLTEQDEQYPWVYLSVLEAGTKSRREASICIHRDKFKEIIERLQKEGLV